MEQDKQGSRQELEGAILSFRDGSCTPGKSIWQLSLSKETDEKHKYGDRK